MRIVPSSCSFTMWSSKTLSYKVLGLLSAPGIVVMVSQHEQSINQKTTRMDKTDSSVEYSDKDEREVAVNTTTCSSEDNAFSNRPAEGFCAGVGVVSRKKAAAIGRVR